MDLQRMTFKELVRHAMNEGLPDGFDQWRLGQTVEGRTIAHALAAKGWLPKAFDAWALADSTGWTVAHEAAVFGQLPATFTQWQFANDQGRTVAHEVAETGRSLPPAFAGWEWADEDGETVIEVARRTGRAALVAQYDMWQLRRSVEESSPAPRMRTLAPA